MKSLKWITLIAVFALFIACEKDKTADLEDGMYAEIKTNKGDILIDLTFTETPATVANFVSLAEGTNTSVTDSVRKGKPYFEGIKFHRVIDKFMVQCGDPTGTGSGGPGYSFQDEFPKDTTGKLLRAFDKKGVLAMANAGPNTNGSQFFITHVPTPHLNGRHTIFGHVVSGQMIVDTIVKNDSILKVNILRKGADAKAFDANAIFTKSLEDFKKEQVAAAEKAKLVTEKETDAFISEMIKTGHKIQTFDNGIILAIKKKGKGKKAKFGDTVSVHYNGRLTTGFEFDSSYKKNQPIEFKLGAGKVIAGWEFGISKINVGTKGVIFIPSNLAWGTRGGGSVIPPHANVIFDIELVKIGK